MSSAAIALLIFVSLQTLNYFGVAIPGFLIGIVGVFYVVFTLYPFLVR
jgi:hypothetical protein